MKAELIKSFERFAEVQQAWNAGLPEDEVESCWLSHEWLGCWWRAFGEDRQLMIPTLWREDTLPLAAPLCIGSRTLKGLKVKTLEFLENGITPRNALIGPQLDE
jgi:hypothetical protein